MPLFRPSCIFGAGLLAILAFGCGKRDTYPVNGRIVDLEGKPIAGLKGGSVQCEGVDVKASAHGAIEEDGSFQLLTNKPGDGARPGKYRAAIILPSPSRERPRPPVIDAKYERMDTSGLEVVVEPKNNDVLLKVERAKGQ